ncbi:MAG: metallophosphoesterase family protein, partial [Acidobacteriota bacterium]
PAHAIDVVLARPTTTSITVSVMAATDMAATLTLEPGGASVPLALKAGVPFEAELTKLTANQQYRYAIAGTAPLASGTFHTARPAGAAFTFDMQADSHLDGNSDARVYTNTITNMLADKADFLVDLGDTFMTDKYPQYQDAAKQYVAQRYYFGLMGATMPAFLTLGNHDGETATRPDMTAWSSAMRKKYFPPVVSNTFYSAGPAALDYYAWTWGDAEFIVLDPFNDTRQKPRDDADGWAWTLGKTQYDWLAKTLESSKARYTFVFIHHLVGGSTREGRGGAEASVFFEWGGQNLDKTAGWAQHRAGWAMPIHDLLAKHHVTAVFHGHDHLYVRQQRDGIVYLEVPQPSHARGDQTNTAQEYGYLTGTLLGSSGHVRVSVAKDGATLEYVKSRLTGTNAEVVDRVVLKPSGGR